MTLNDKLMGLLSEHARIAGTGNMRLLMDKFFPDVIKTLVAMIDGDKGSATEVVSETPAAPAAAPIVAPVAETLVVAPVEAPAVEKVDAEPAQDGLLAQAGAFEAEVEADVANLEEEAPVASEGAGDAATDEMSETGDEEDKEPTKAKSARKPKS